MGKQDWQQAGWYTGREQLTKSRSPTVISKLRFLSMNINNVERRE